jgi:hypothetical protein
VINLWYTNTRLSNSYVFGLCEVYGYIQLSSAEGRRVLERARRRWENHIKMDLNEVGWVAWTGSIWLRIGTGDGLL